MAVKSVARAAKPVALVADAPPALLPSSFTLPASASSSALVSSHSTENLYDAISAEHLRRSIIVEMAPRTLTSVASDDAMSLLRFQEAPLDQ